MKNYLMLCFVFLFLSSLGQDWTNNLPQEKLDKNSLTFYDYQNAFNQFYENKNIENGYYFDENGNKIKAPGWKQFKRQEWFLESRIELKSGYVPVKAFDAETLKNIKSAKSGEGDWTNLGTSTSTGGYAGIGRLNCIAFHPSDANTFWVGAPSGGLWKTTDGGSTWTVLTDNNPVLGVSDIAVPSDYATSNTLYIATGDRDGGSMWSLGGSYNDNNTVGVLKTTDGGETWTETGLSFNINQSYITTRLLILPSDNNTIFASTSAGVYKTTNGGTDWTKLSTVSLIDMEFKPGDPTVMYGSTKDYTTTKIYKSSNSGVTWSEVLSKTGRRTELAVSPDDPTVVYAIMANSTRGLEGIYKSTNSGASYTEIFDGDVSGNNMLGYYSDGSGDPTGQGSYDLCIAVDPNDINKVYIGGVNGWKSTNGGTTWECMNMWTSSGTYNFSGEPAVHADKHFLAFQNSSSVLFECNDGGVYKSTDNGNTWTDLTNGMVISQIYRIGASQQNVNEIICGLQDNGTKLYTNGSWWDVKGGDGMECIIDYSNDNTQYGTYVRGDVARTTNHWSSATDITQDADGPINGLDEMGAWVTPYVMDPINNQTLYIGLENVWKTTNQGNAWTKISSMNTTDKIRSLAIAPSNSQYLYAADQSTIWKTTNGGTSWTDITSGLPGTYAITYITVKHDDPNTLWVTFGGYDTQRIYESNDGGSNWTNISSGLPSFPVLSVIENKQAAETQLYVGTDVGVYVKHGTENWILFSYNLPNVVVTELDIYYDESNSENSRINAGTYGRGLWQSPLYAPITADIDAAVYEIYQPEEEYCSNTFAEPAIVIRNNGNTILTSLTVGYNIDGGTDVTKNWSGSLSTNEKDTIYFGTIEISGSHTINAFVSNPNGTIDENTDNDIKSLDFIVKSTAHSFTEDFETSTSPPTCWEIINPDDSKTWERTTLATGNGSSTAALMMDFYSYSSTGQTDDIISVPIDLSFITSSQLTFNVAYRQYSTEADALRIYVSTDNGTTYNASPVYSKAGSTLATLASSTTEFYPSSSGDWRLETVDLSAYDGEIIKLKFQSETDYGNNLFIDDIEVSGTITNTLVAGNASAINNPICDGESATLILEDYNGTIQWQESTDNITFSDASTGSGYTTAAYTTNVLTATMYYRAKVAQTGYADVFSDTVTITINQAPAGGNAETTDADLCEGESTTLNLISYTGTIQWQESLNGLSFIDVTEGTGITTDSYTTALTESKYFRAKVMNGNCGPAYSDTVSINVTPLPVVGEITPSSLDTCVNSNIELALIDFEGTFKWEISENNIDFTEVLESNDTLYTGILTSNKYYRAHVYTICGSSYTDTVEITIHAAPVVGDIEASDEIVCTNSSVIITASNYTGNLQWYQSIDNVEDIIAGQTTSVLNISAVTDTTYYYYTVSNPYCPAIGSIAAVVKNINSPIVSVFSAEEDTICSGSYISVGLDDYSFNTTYSWEKSTDNETWETIENHTGPSLYTNQFSNSIYLRIVGDNSYCPIVYSNPQYIEIKQPSDPGDIGTDSPEICSGETATLSLENYLGSITWQQSYDYTTWNDIVGENNDIYITNELTESTFFRAKVTNFPCNEVFSSRQQIYVQNLPVAGTITSNRDTFCIGEKVYLQLEGYAGDILWEKSFDNIIWDTIANADYFNLADSVLQKAYYRAGVNNRLCDKVYSDTFQLYIYPEAIAGFSFNIEKATVQFTDESENANQFYWFFGDDDISSEQNPTHIYTETGIYEVMQKVRGKCKFDSTKQNVEITEVSIYSFENNKNVILFPNPNNGQFEIQLNNFNSDVNIQIFSIKGDKVFEKEIRIDQIDYHLPISIDKIEAGLYTLIIKDEKEYKTTFIVK